MDDNDVNSQCPKHGNSWLIRNDSSNVSAVLNSGPYSFEYESNFLNKLKKPVVVSDHCCKVYKPQKFHCGECYCRKSPVCPKLAVKPPSHTSAEPKILGYKKLKHERKCDYAKCYLASLQNREYSDTPYLQYTTSRQTYEKFRTPEYLKQNNIKTSKTYEDDFTPEEQLMKLAELTNPENFKEEHLKEVNNHGDTTVSKGLKLPSRGCTSPVLPTIIENEKEQTSTNTKMSDDATSNGFVFLDSNTSTEVNLKKLNTFRKENYFDCHSTANLGGSKTPDHKCVHKFVLNNRLVPQPLHADTFGRSRCIICDKPINSERNKCSQTDSKTFTKTSAKSQKNVFKKPCCGEHKTPHKIYISNRNDRIEVRVPLSYTAHDEIFKTCKVKNPLSANSLALRHQKGVV